MKTKPHPNIIEPKPSHEQIAERARGLWMTSGCPDGRDLEFWLAAENLFLDPSRPPTGTIGTISRNPAGKITDAGSLAGKTEEMLAHTGQPGRDSPTSLNLGRS